MVIVDTSIWVEHLRIGNTHLEELLLDAEVMCHEFIIGELACGNLKNRNEILSLLQSLPHSPTIDHQEFLYFIDKHRLMGRGAGFVDIHLLASAQITNLPIWTADKRLKKTAEELQLHYTRR
jgi:predicted nucleic acid-binding protein